MARVLRNHWRCFLIAAVLAGLAARLAWIASHTATGWETTADDWREATIGQFTWHRLPVAQALYRRQTEFWMPEIDRILACAHKTPELLQGAIWMLGNYNGDYHLPLSANLVAVPDLDFSDEIRYRRYDPTGQGRRTKQLQLAATATTEFPDSAPVWQTRAELESQYVVPSEKMPDVLDWGKTLNDCQAHDPGNSLYDFLAADRLFIEANQLAITDEYAVANGNSPSDEVLREHRLAEIEREDTAIQHIEHGLGLPKFEMAHDKTAIYKLIDATSLPLVEKAHLAAWCDTGHFSLGDVIRNMDECIARMQSRDPNADTTAARRMAMHVCELNAALPMSDPFMRYRDAVLRGAVEGVARLSNA